MAKKINVLLLFGAKKISGDKGTFIWYESSKKSQR